MKNERIRKRFRRGLVLLLALTLAAGLCTGCAFKASDLTELINVEKFKEKTMELGSLVTDLIDEFRNGDDNRAETAVETAGDESAYETDEKTLSLNGSIYYYYYKKLNSSEKAEYRKLLGAYKNRTEMVVLNLTEAEAKKMESMVNADHPELFWVDSGNYTYKAYEDRVELTPQYNRSLKKLKSDRRKLNSAVKKILKKAPKKGTDYEKVKYVYEYLIKNVSYKGGAKDNQNVYSAIVRGKSVCAGYAKATQLLLQKLGVRSIYVTGTTEDGSHAWNKVRCGKKYYNVDTTWGNPNYQNKSAMKGVPAALKIDYSYLCINDRTLSRTHSASEDLELPNCTATDLEYYSLNGLYFNKYGKTTKKSITAAIKAGKKTWQGKFARKSSYQAAVKAMKNGAYGKLITQCRKSWSKTYYITDDEKQIIKLYYK